MKESGIRVFFAVCLFLAMFCSFVFLIFLINEGGIVNFVGFILSGLCSTAVGAVLFLMEE